MTQDGAAHLLCSLCGDPITGRWMAEPDVNGNLNHFHADTGIYGQHSYLSCAMVIAQNASLASKGWRHPPGCVTYVDAAGKTRPIGE